MGNDNQERILQALKKYQKMELPIIPCQGKAPYVKDWPHSGVPSDQKIKEWVNNYPDLNIGLVLGQTSNIICVDADGKDAMIKLRQLANEELPDTWMYLTPGGGKHWLYKILPGIKFSKYVIPLEGDHCELAFLGDGQQAILPPSIHPNGSAYRWDNGHSPDDIEIAEIPEFISKLMTQQQIQSEAAALPTPNEDNALVTLSKHCPCFKEDWETQQQSGLDEGQWFNWISLLTSAGHAQLAKTFSQSSKKHNVGSEERLKKLSDNNIKGMVRCTTLGCKKEDIQRCFLNKVRLNNKQITNSPGAFIYVQAKTASAPSKYTQKYLEKIGFIFKDEKPVWVNANKFAAHITEKLDLLYFGPGDCFYYYDKGVWSLYDFNTIARRLRNLLHQYVPDMWSEKLEKEYIEALKREAPRVEKLDTNREYINLENGMLSLNTFELVEHRKEFYSSVQIPLAFDNNAKCPRFKKFLNDVFEGDNERIALTGEIMGYCLTAEVKSQKAFILYGRGSNGKSVLAEILECLCGQKNVSAVPLQELENPFTRYELVDKLLNLATENEVNRNGLSTQHFKSIVTGDPIRVEKKYEKGFTYRPFCKMVFALNNLPYSRDKSYGFERRLIILPFNRVFTGKAVDPNLSSKLKKGLAGILNFALEGLERLRKNEYTFTESKVVNETLDEYKETLNPISTFVLEKIIATNNPMDKVSHTSIRKAYAVWCLENGQAEGTIASSRSFIKNIKDALKDNNTPFGVKKGGNKRFITGVKLKINSQEASEMEMVDDIECICD